VLHTIRYHLQNLKSDPQCGIFTMQLTLVSNSFQDYAYTRSNFAFSPYGVASVLVVLYEGARGESARQIHNTLRLPWNVDVTRIGFRDIHRHLRVSTFVTGIELGYTCNLQVLESVRSLMTLRKEQISVPLRGLRHRRY